MLTKISMRATACLQFLSLNLHLSLNICMAIKESWADQTYSGFSKTSSIKNRQNFQGKNAFYFGKSLPTGRLTCFCCEFVAVMDVPVP